MMRCTSPMLLAVLLMVCSASAVFGVELTYVPVQDATICSENVDGALANGPLTVGRTNGAALRRSLLLFNVEAETPSNFSASGLESASLSLVWVKGTSDSSISFSLHALQQPWTVGSSTASKGQCVSATTGDVTYMYTSYNSSEWVTNGGDYDATPLATASISNNTLIFDVTDAVVGILDGGVNYGWIVIGDESMDMSTAQFESSESASNKPSLIVLSNASLTTAASVVAAFLVVLQLAFF
eukprot:m.53742 g.53742  ORF g.53742 m.53742 type:complete len:241 (+) comp7682_c0_seq1:70-792(+)